jgi:methionine-gamma-lyase
MIQERAMAADTYHKTKIGNRTLHPETQMMGYGFDPHLSEGSLKPPVFLTSTFVFKTAQDGKDFFDFTSGRRQPEPGQSAGLVYSRFNNPNLEVLEDRLALWDGAEAAAVFSSGMSAISTTLWAYLRPGDVIFTSRPLYGGTETLIDKTLPNYGIKIAGFTDGCSIEAMRKAAKAAMKEGRIGLIMTETPANPTNGLVDLQAVATVADEIAKAQGGYRPPVAVDNTFLGPVFQRPLSCGADIAVYSLTKYVGGHSDLVAGGVTGSKALLQPIRSLRSALGTQLDPNTSWMLLRSMETLQLRMERANDNAKELARYLRVHPKIAAVNYLGFIEEDDPRRAVYDRQCRAPGSTFSFMVKGGEAEAFRALDRLQVMKLAVSLGGTETLVSHPASTTHSGVPKAQRDGMGITDAMIRISVGIENVDDLIADLEQALSGV